MYLRELHNTVIKTYKEIDSHIVIPRPKKTPYNSINDSYMISSNFIPPSVEIEMNKNSHAYTHYNYTITFGKSKCNLSIVTKKNISKKEMRKIVVRIFLIPTMAKREEEFSLLLYFTDYNKTFGPTKNLGINEINSAVTIFPQDNNHNIIGIFRKEEMLKSIIHEMIHCMDIDDRHFNIDFSKIFNIPNEPDFKVFEAYTEMLAVVINTMLLSYETDNRSNWRLFKRGIASELKFTLFQIAKILVHYGFTNIAEFNQPYNCNKFQQTTSVFSYFFIKGALLFQLEYFMDLINKYGSCDKKNILKWDNENMHILNRLYVDFSQQPDFLKNIDDYMSYIRETKLDTKLKMTLRMTNHG
jgi:hypothetical protein